MPAESAIHVVLTFDDNFWAPAFTVARSICLTTTRRRDVTFHLLHDGLKPERRTDFAALADEFGCRVVHYELSDNAEFNAICRALPVDKRLHTVMYARLLVDRILPADVDRLIYLDCDTMVLTPIERLYGQDLAGRTIGAVSDPVRILNMMGRDMRQKTGIFESTTPYFNSGMLLIDRARFAAARIPDRIAEFRRTGILDKLYFDQDMLNLIFRGDWTELSWRFNVMDPRVAHQTMDPWILHYTGHARPWFLYANVAHRRTYRHVMTNDLFYRYMRHRWARRLRRLVGGK
jgi:lipopolysaccharide biosynthesis glycosyltransferase